MHALFVSDPDRALRFPSPLPIGLLCPQTRADQNTGHLEGLALGGRGCPKGIAIFQGPLHLRPKHSILQTAKAEYTCGASQELNLRKPVEQSQAVNILLQRIILYGSQDLLSIVRMTIR